MCVREVTREERERERERAREREKKREREGEMRGSKTAMQRQPKPTLAKTVFPFFT